MRKLSDEELKHVRMSIFHKEISSAEILMEVYDHFISHLQEFPMEEFNNQLFELEQKFTYGYCHALQSKFNKSAKAEIGKIQWQVIRQYFCTSRWIFAAGILAVIFYIASNTRSHQELGLLFLSPLILLTVMLLLFNWRVYKKMRPIKKTFKGMGIPIQSSLATPLSERFYLPVLFGQTVLGLPKIISVEFQYDHLLPAISAVVTAILTLYLLSLLEAWKIKSKTTLI